MNTGRLSQYQFHVASQTDTGALTWNANGTLKQLAITDQINTANSQTCSFGHDDLSRIGSVSCGATWSQTFSLDPFGNLSKSGTSSFLPTYNLATNRFQTVPGGTPTYDANGNLTNDLSHTYSWDAEGKALTIDGSTVGLTYDALGRMVEQARGAAYTEIVYGPGGGKLALMNGQTLSKAFIPLPAGATAVYTASGLAYYRHADWLGSARLASTPSRGVYYDGAYAPYGESYAESGTADRSFTGQNQDTVSGLYDFMFREYHAVQGRWISPDPAGLGAVNPASPQSWNRYAYVSNNPLRLTDPLGLFTCGNCPAPPPDISPDDITIFSGAVGWGPDYYSLIFKHGPGRGSWSDLIPLPTAVAPCSTVPNFLNSSGPTGVPDQEFGSVVAAGMAAVNYANGTSIMIDKEEIGLIYQNPSGSFSFTTPTIADKAGFHGSLPYPNDVLLAGGYHTHGAFDPSYENEIFSWRDRMSTSSLRNSPDFAGGSPVEFLGTPEGNTLLFISTSPGSNVSPGTGIDVGLEGPGGCYSLSYP